MLLAQTEASSGGVAVRRWLRRGASSRSVDTRSTLPTAMVYLASMAFRVLWLLSSCNLEVAAIILLVVLLRWETEATGEASQRSCLNKLDGGWRSSGSCGPASSSTRHGGDEEKWMVVFGVHCSGSPGVVLMPVLAEDPRRPSSWRPTL